MSERKKYIDIAKGIGILLVLIGHIDWGNYILTNTIYSFHMPLFFVIAGYTFNYEKYEKNIKMLITSKFKSLMLPYIAFSSILIIFSWNQLENKNAFQILYTIAYGIGVKFPIWIMVPLWFLPALFVAIILHFFVLKLTRKNNRYIRLLIIVIFSLIGYFITQYYNKGLYCLWSIDLALMSLIFIYIGMKCREYKLVENIDKLKIYKKICIAIVIIIIDSFIVKYNGRVDMNVRLFGNVLEFYCSGIMMSLLIIIFSKILDNTKILSKSFSIVGQNSLYLLGLHFWGANIFLNKFTEIIPRIMGIISRSVFIKNLTMFIWELLFTLVLAFVIKRMKYIVKKDF